MKGSKAPGKGKRAAQITAVILAGIILLAAGGVGGWYLKKQFEPKAEVDHNNQIAITPDEEENGIMTLSAETVATEDGTKVHRLTATLKPEGSDDTVDWSIAWGEEAVYWDGQEIGQDKADKGEVTEYVTLTPTSDGALTADVVGLKDFGTKAVITAAVRSNPEIKATCIVDYVMRMTEMNIRLYHTDKTNSAYNAKMKLSFYMTENEEEAYQAALHPVRPSLLNTTSFPLYEIEKGTFQYIHGACATDDKLIEGTSIESEAKTSSPSMEGSCTYILEGDDLILSECATIRYAQALFYGMSYALFSGAQDQIVYYTSPDAEFNYRPTWEEFRPVGAQFTGSLLEDGVFNLKVGDRPLRIKDVLINRFTNQPDPYAEDGVSMGIFDGGNDKGIIYDYEKNLAEVYFDWDIMKSHLQNPIATVTGEEMSKYSLIFKLEIPKTGQVGFYAVEFDYPASSVNLDNGNLYI